MNSLEAKVQELRSIDERLKDARRRRDEAFTSRSTSSAQIDKLDAEIEGLQRAQNAALHALHEAVKKSQTTD
jgi:predicted  nucleic acid-binding Zn-ribbon protein